MKGRWPQPLNIWAHSRISLVGSPPTSLTGSQNGRMWSTPAWATATACVSENTVVQKVSTPRSLRMLNALSPVDVAGDLEDDLLRHVGENLPDF